MNTNKQVREIEIPYEEQKKIFKFLEDYATNPSNSNKYRYGLIGYLQDELLPALMDKLEVEAVEQYINVQIAAYKAYGLNHSAAPVESIVKRFEASLAKLKGED